MPRLVSRAEFARLAGVSKPAVTKACAGPLAPACERDRVDLDHPLAVEYLARRRPQGEPAQAPEPPASPPSDRAPTEAPKQARRRPAAPTPPRRRAPREPADTTTLRPDELPEQPENAGTSEDLDELARAIRPLLRRFGTERQFRDWLVALKDIEAIRKSRLDNEETEGTLISRELVKTHVFGAIEASHRRLLGDASKTIARKLFALAKSGGTVEEAEAEVRKALSDQINPVKTTAARVLRRGEDARTIRDA